MATPPPIVSGRSFLPNAPFTCRNVMPAFSVTLRKITRGTPTLGGGSSGGVGVEKYHHAEVVTTAATTIGMPMRSFNLGIDPSLERDTCSTEMASRSAGPHYRGTRG